MADSAPQKGRGLLHETPNNASLPHIANYIAEFGRVLKRHRLNHKTGKLSADDFGKHVLKKYFGTEIVRSRVIRAENGETGVHWGVIAAYIHDMGIWPSFLKLCLQDHTPSRHHTLLVHKEIERQKQLAKQESLRKLIGRAKSERINGVITK